MKSLESSLLSIPRASSYLRQVEREIDTVLSTSNQAIKRPLRRLTHTNSKRLRPLFVLAVASSQGAKINKNIIRACVVVELLHIGSLIHDDIIDQSSLRWGVPTINNLEGQSQALLIGDYCFAKAFTQAALIGKDVTAIIGPAMAALCDGQSREMADQFNTGRSLTALKTAHMGKTASLFAMACNIGAVCANFTSAQIDNLINYGLNFGMSFQLIDDLLDLLSTEELLGKTVGSDVISGIYTMPVLVSLRGPSRQVISDWLDNKKIDSAKLVRLLLHDGSIKKSVDKIQQYNQIAAHSLDSLGSTELVRDLKDLPNRYMNLAFARLIAKPYKATIAEYIA
jgi:geranylgeranyl pyrophosphate synthase